MDNRVHPDDHPVVLVAVPRPAYPEVRDRAPVGERGEAWDVTFVAKRGRTPTATPLLVQGVDQRVVMGMFGWTSAAMTTRYQHVVPELVNEASRRMTDLLWGPSGESRQR